MNQQKDSKNIFPPFMGGKERLFIFLIFIFTLALRLALISQKNLWFDEIYSWHLSQESIMTIIFTTWEDIHPPLFYILLKLWIFIFGDSPLSLRLLPAFCSSIAMFFIYPVSRKILGKELSTIVLILYALSPLNIFYSQEVRMAAVNLLLNTISSYYFIKILDNLNFDTLKFKSGPIKFYVIFSVLSLYTHYFSIFILLSHIIYLLYLKGKSTIDKKLFLKAYLVIFLSYLVWIPIMVIQISRGQPWRYEQNITQVLYQIKSFILDIGLGFYQRYADTTIVSYFFYLLIVLIILTLFGFYSRFYKNLKIKKSTSALQKETSLLLTSKNIPQEKEGSNYNFIFLIILISIIPFLFAVIVSFKQWIEFFRYLSIIVPFIIILFVYALSVYKSIFKYILIGIFLMINLYGLDLYYRNNSKNNDYRGILETINKSPNPSAIIFVYPFYYGWILDYYKKIGEYPKINHQDYGWEFHGILDSIKSQKLNEFWFILDYHSFDTSSYNEKLKKLTEVCVMEYDKTFFIKPEKVEMYRIKKK